MKNMKIWLVLFAVVLTAGVVGSALALQKSESNIVEIVQDGKVLYRLDLSEYKDTESIEIAYGGGRNTVLIENGQICMSQADCPDQTCVKMGWLKTFAMIAYLPFLLISGCAAGAFTGGCAQLVVKRSKEVRLNTQTRRIF